MPYGSVWSGRTDYTPPYGTVCDMAATQRLGRGDWLAGAWELVTAEGFDRLAVEPLARRLHTTKGSFYWHFADRNDLVQAMLTAWEAEATNRVIGDVERLTDRRSRFAAVVGLAMRIDGSARTEWAVVSAHAHPEVGPVVRRVHRRRIAYLTGVLVDLGVPDGTAETRARVAYAAYLGNLELAMTGLGDLKSGERFHREVVAMAVAGTPPGLAVAASPER